MRHYCFFCGAEKKYIYKGAKRGKRKEKIEVYVCPDCGHRREIVVA